MEIKAKTVLSGCVPRKECYLTIPDVLVSSSDVVRDETVVGRGQFGNVTPQGRSAAELIFAAGSLEML